MKPFYITKYGPELIRKVTLIKGENPRLSINWNGYLQGDTIATSTWTVETGTLTLASAANSGGVTSTLATASSVGERILKNAITTTTGGETLVRKFLVNVVDPEVQIADYEYGV